VPPGGAQASGRTRHSPATRTSTASMQHPPGTQCQSPSPPESTRRTSQTPARTARRQAGTWPNGGASGSTSLRPGPKTTATSSAGAGPRTSFPKPRTREPPHGLQSALVRQGARGSFRCDSLAQASLVSSFNARMPCSSANEYCRHSDAPNANIPHSCTRTHPVTHAHQGAPLTFRYPGR
jgi:hypothetical protein